MEKLPPELLAGVAELLSTQDLRAFRLACWRWARIAFPIIARRLYIINTVSCLVEFKAFLDTIPTTFTRELVIYQGKWPVFSRREWEISPLLLYERYPYPSHSAQAIRSNHLTAEAFLDYRSFIRSERERSKSWDSNTMMEILGSLPNLRSVLLECLQPWGQMPLTNPKLSALRRKLWISPTFNGSTDGLIGCVVKSSTLHPTFRILHVRGRLHSSTLQSLPLQLVTDLQLGSLVVHPKESWTFLSRLPNLRRLEITAAIDSPLAIFQHRETLSSLEILALERLYVNEDYLVTLMTNSPALKMVRLVDMRLASGSWKSCFYQIRRASRRTSYELKGAFGGIDPTCERFLLEGGAKILLSHFLKDPSSSWPFVGSAAQSHVSFAT